MTARNWLNPADRAPLRPALRAGSAAEVNSRRGCSPLAMGVVAGPAGAVPAWMVSTPTRTAVLHGPRLAFAAATTLDEANTTRANSVVIGLRLLNRTHSLLSTGAWFPNSCLGTSNRNHELAIGANSQLTCPAPLWGPGQVQ